MTTLSAKTRQLLKLLQIADGGFVRGPFLAASLSIDMTDLSNQVRYLRAARHDLVIEGKHGKGYRIAAPDEDGVARQLAITAAAAIPVAAANGKPMHSSDAVDGKSRLPGDYIHQRLSANLALLDLLPRKSALVIKQIALESGENVDACAARLIAYGAEVHRDLVGSGENPLALKAAA